jgi:WD40 repeat protein
LTPLNTSAPTISGIARLGHALAASSGSWSGSSPMAYGYQWSRCDAAGANCVPITGASRPTYQIAEADVNGTLRVTVTAYNAAGASEPALSAAREVSNPPSSQHLEYVLNDGRVSVYDIDNNFALVKTISLPQLEAGVRGVSVAPSTHLMFISYGGDGGGNGSGSVLAYDLLAERVVWTVHLGTGIDSGALSPDGKRLYEPTGENSSSGIWNILDTSNGEVIGTIQGGAGAHNTIASADGRYVYLGGRNYDYLDVYETSTGHVREVGPLVGGVRPFTVNGSNTLAFTAATEFDGFQVSSLTSGKVLYTVPFGTIPSGFPFTTASHGISISPDEKQLYVLDAVNKEVQVWDVSRVSEGVAPSQLGVVPVAGLSGEEGGCAYDCERDGWIQLSIDGRYAFVGDSGDVIETATRKVVANLPTLANTRKSIEVEWAGGVPVATSTRLGVGKVG